MLKLIPHKFLCKLLLLVMLCIAIGGVHESAHAAQCDSVTNVHAVHADPGAGDTSPAPFDHHDESDGCDTCVNCACHAPLTVSPLQLRYNPLVLDISTFEPSLRFPEVYLSKFIPPQITA